MKPAQEKVPALYATLLLDQLYENPNGMIITGFKPLVLKAPVG
jgi:hypothetical protein